MDGGTCRQEISHRTSVRSGLRSTPGEKQQVDLLVRHFLSRFFDNELVPPLADARVPLIHILALLAVPGLLTSFNVITKYAALARGPAALHHGAVLDDRLFFSYFSMVVIGFVTAFEWDSLFPDRRDYSILVPLPIRARTLFSGKIRALCIFLVLFSCGVNLFSTLLFPLVSQRGAEVNAGVAIVAHAVTVFAGDSFVFFSVVACQGLFMNVFGFRVFKRTSRAIQFLLMVLFLSVFFLMPRISFDALSRNEAFLNWFPPAWFLGLHQTIAPSGEIRLENLAHRALWALGAALIAFALTYYLSYKRHLQRTLESEEPGRSESGIWKSVMPVLHELVLRDIRERAYFCFVAKTVMRSHRQRILLGAYIGVGVAFVVMALLTVIGRKGMEGLSQVDSSLLSIPLVLSFFILVGMRMIFSIPAELGSNWAFKLAEGEGRLRGVAAVHKVMLFLGVIPLFAGLLPIYLIGWGWQTALLHVSYGLVLALFLIECLLFKLNKIPFTCSYLPGKANLKLLWWVYLFMFTTYAYGMAEVEQRLLQRPTRFIFFYAAAFTVIAWMIRRRRNRSAASHFIYDETPGPLVRTLDLNA
jgi:hypothetical protein